MKPEKFLVTKLTYENGEISTSVFRSDKKVPVHWSSKIPKKFKRNAVNVDLYRAKNIASDFSMEKKIVVEKFESAGFPSRFVTSVIKSFHEKELDDPKIPENLFKLPKKFVCVNIPYCQQNEELSKKFMEKFHNFTNEKFGLMIK